MLSSHQHFSVENGEEMSDGDGYGYVSGESGGASGDEDGGSGEMDCGGDLYEEVGKSCSLVRLCKCFLKSHKLMSFARIN